ncbi:MAG: Aerobic cobaltochelatase subunit CobN [Hyphomicrobiaceae bacterium hypho_1]
MHLLALQTGEIKDGDEPRDLQQSPGDVVVLSAADTELGLLAAAHCAQQKTGSLLQLRLANILHLKHNFSIDLYTEKTLFGTKLVVLRLLGGKGYWPYGVERLVELASAGTFELAVLPGDDKPDASLAGLSTVPENICSALWHLLSEGGQHNAGLFLDGIAQYLKGEKEIPIPRPVLRAGLYDRTMKNVVLGSPKVCIIFYRALMQSGDLEGIDLLMNDLVREGLTPLAIYAASLRDPVCAETVIRLLRNSKPSVILNTTAFNTSQPGQFPTGGLLAEFGVPVLQIVLSSGTKTSWQSGTRGLSAQDIAMHVALPEIDGRLLTNAVSFKADAIYDAATEYVKVRAKAVPDRVAQVVKQVKAWSILQHIPRNKKKVAIVLANYPNRDARLANGVGLDTPASTINLLQAMSRAGYSLQNIPENGNSLMEHLKRGPTNDTFKNRKIRERLSLTLYRDLFSKLPDDVRLSVEARWHKAEDDPSCINGEFLIPATYFGNVIVTIQPARGYNIDPKSTYHDPSLVPPHRYLAFYFWLRYKAGVHAVIHLGKHGNLEWLPGKALALSENCFPEVALGALPNIYPFIVNDPGEGSQAKRRTSAVIIDHLMPAMTRAESYGPITELEALIDEFHEATGVDESRRKLLETRIIDASVRLGLDKDCGFNSKQGGSEMLQLIDNHICDIKELQIRDGLHTLGTVPTGRARTDTLVAIARLQRGNSIGRNASILQALTNDLGLNDFNPLDTESAKSWRGDKPQHLMQVSSETWRTAGDTIERLEMLAAALIAGEIKPEPGWTQTHLVLQWIAEELAPSLDKSGDRELDGILRALDGLFVYPGPSGAPTRGRPDVLPTGRNFFSLDSRTLPTRAAWELGFKSAERVIDRYCQDHGDWPRAIAISAWGTSNMRTGGDDIAQALALMGVCPNWEVASGRVTGFEIISLAKLGRPRVDVTFRMSGFFRDAFPAQIDLLYSAVQAVAGLDESDRDNPLAEHTKKDTLRLCRDGLSEPAAWRQATNRIFGSMPGAYGAGLQALIDEKIWNDEKDLADAYITWGHYVYGGGQEGLADRDGFKRRVASINAVLHNQDNREHDLLDSDDYYQFVGGLTVTAKVLAGKTVPVYFNDHSRPTRPLVRVLEEEIGRVVRGRAVNPKWLSGIMRHGYKGAFEIAATVDYLFSFAATTNAVGNHHFDALYDAYLGDEEVRNFLNKNNQDALREIAEKFKEAIERKLWSPRRNSIPDLLAQLTELKTN